MIQTIISKIVSFINKRNLLFFVLITLKSLAYGYDFEVDGLCYNVIANGQVEVTYRDKSGGSYNGNLVIPEKVIYNSIEYKVVSIGKLAFYQCRDLTGVLKIPNSVTSIGESAFSGCRGFTGALEIPNSVTSIGESAFSWCRGFTGDLTIPSSVTSIGYGAFSYCDGFSGSLTIPNSVISIGEFAFASCSGFTGSLTISNSVTIIRESVFHQCRGFTGSLTIPNSVTSIEKDAFAYCRGFTGTLTIPSSVHSIGEFAFCSCTGIASLKIPNSVTTIGADAFLACSSLEFVYSEIAPPFSIGNNAFSRIADNAILYVPQGTKKDYQQFTEWVDDFCYILEEGESIPNKTYSLLISASGSGSVSFGNDIIRDGSQDFTVDEGVNAKISFNPDNGYRVKSVKVNGSSVDAGSSYTFTVNSDTKVDVEFEAIPVTKYTLVIKASGNGSASYSGESIRETTKTYSVNEGSNISVSFSPDNGYRIKSLKVNNSSVSVNTSYSTTMNSDIKVEVEFEAIPVTTYTLTITASGNGSASYSNETIRGGSKSFTVNEGTSAKISFNPDSGYRVKSVKVNNSSVDAGSSYTVTVNSNTKVEVEFEAIPVTTYTLTITASGNGSASYGGESIRGGSKSFTVNEGTSAKISFSPDSGYRIKSVKVNGSGVDAGSSYTVTVNSDTKVEVEFEAIPATTYTLTITASGNGSASYGGESIRGGSKSFTVNEGTNAKVSFSPDSGYRVKSVKVNGSGVDASSSYTVTVNSNTTVAVEFEAIPVDPTPTPTPTTYTLSISASGNGSASYGGESIRGGSKSFTVNEGTSAKISFSPDSGYRIKSVKVNGSGVDAGSSYTVTVNSNTKVEVEFEAIPVTTYTLTITASGNGSASYSNETIRGGSKSFTVNEGTNAKVSFSPDSGYRVKSVKVNGSGVDASSSYTVTVNSNTTVAVEFEAIPVDPTPTPTPTTYTLSISASGNGSASYGNETIRSGSKSFTVNEGTSATISFSPDNGYRVKSVKVNNSSVDAGSSYTVTVNSNTTVAVEFEEIPVTTYTLTISAIGNGIASYNGTSVRNESRDFSISEGSSPIVSFTPDDFNLVKIVKLNGSEVSLSDNSYTISNVSSDNKIEVEYEEIDAKFTTEGVNYQVSSYESRSVVIGVGEYGLSLEVPEKVVSQGYEWTIFGISDEAMSANKELAAIIWNPSTTINFRNVNPNLLLYVKDARYAPYGVNNVVINNEAESILLTESPSGNNFYCPRSFTAKKITYSHRYRMRTGGGESRGWETIALPFDVQKIEHADEGPIVPFANWSTASTEKPFWLYQLSASGFVETDGIKANTPYIISMPNNDVYQNDYILRGTVIFSSTNVEVKKSDDIVKTSYGNRTFIPNFLNLDNNAGYYALNVNNDMESYQGSENEGSVFVQNLRRIHPFEAYMTSTSGTRSIGVFDDMTTAIKGIEEMEKGLQTLKVYNLNGQCIKAGTSMDALKQELPAGLYIINNKKIIIK